MARRLGIALAVILLLVGVAAVYGYVRVSSLGVVRVTDDVHVLTGLGGNVGVLRTDVGAVVVDTMTFRMQGARIRERAEELGGGPVQAIVNTHYHGDHTHGNPAFPGGTRVISTDRTLDYLMFFDAGYWQGEAAETKPNETFESTHELRVGGKTLRLHHLGRGHTGGDLVVELVEDRVLHLGDLLFHEHYPNIDLEAGGSVRDWAATLDRVLALDFDHVIPGHGPVTDREGVRRFQTFVRELGSVGEEAARAGWSLDETLDRAELEHDEGFSEIGIPLVMTLDRDFVIRRAWEEATGAVRPLEVPRVR